MRYFISAAVFLTALSGCAHTKISCTVNKEEYKTGRLCTIEVKNNRGRIERGDAEGVLYLLHTIDPAFLVEDKK